LQEILALQGIFRLSVWSAMAALEPWFFLHTGEVQGSIPCAPTSLRSLRELRLGKPGSIYRSEASEGCRAEALGEGGPGIATRQTKAATRPAKADVVCVSLNNLFVLHPKKTIG
jgi:hypothetical protein